MMRLSDGAQASACRAQGYAAHSAWKVIKRAAVWLMVEWSECSLVVADYVEAVHVVRDMWLLTRSCVGSGG